MSVHVEFTADAVLVRNATPGVDPTYLVFTHQQWAEFIAGVRNDEFNPPERDA